MAKKRKGKRASGKDRDDRMEKAYTEFIKGKTGSLQKLADKYRLHVPDISRYITHKFELAKIEKDGTRS